MSNSFEMAWSVLKDSEEGEEAEPTWDAQKLINGTWIKWTDGKVLVLHPGGYEEAFWDEVGQNRFDDDPDLMERLFGIGSRWHKGAR